MSSMNFYDIETDLGVTFSAFMYRSNSVVVDMENIYVHTFRFMIPRVAESPQISYKALLSCNPNKTAGVGSLISIRYPSLLSARIQYSRVNEVLSTSPCAQIESNPSKQNPLWQIGSTVECSYKLTPKTSVPRNFSSKVQHKEIQLLGSCSHVLSSMFCINPKGQYELHVSVSMNLKYPSAHSVQLFLSVLQHT